MAANLVQFVESDLTTSRLVLDYIEGGTHIPLPSHTKIWSGNITAHGSDYITGKYENVPINLSLKITGASQADLDNQIQALVAELTRENILNIRYDGGPVGGIFYNTFPYDAAEARSVLERAYRDAYMVFGFDITLMAEPFAYTAEESITIVDNLAPNWNMETFTAPNVPDDWTVTVSAGCAVTEDNTAGDYIFGTSSVQLATDGSDPADVAQIATTAYIPITSLAKHYCLVYNYQREVGTTGTLHAYIDQYTAAPALIESTEFSPTIDTLDTWFSVTGVMHATGEGGNDWAATCTQCKIRFTVTGTLALTEFNVDGIVFTQSEYLSGNTLSNPLGIVVPSTALSGDVPSPVDIYLAAFDNTVDNKLGIYVGGRKNYDDDFTPYLSSATGTAAYSSMANQNDYRTIVIPGELILNGTFETWAGTWDTPDFDNWTEAEGAGTGNITADTGGSQYEGSWSVYMYASGSTAETLSMTSDYTNVNIANDYLLSLYYTYKNSSGSTYFRVEVNCYNAASALVGTLTALNTFTTRLAYTQLSYAIPIASWPATTTKVKIVISLIGKTGDNCEFDLVSLRQTTTTISLDGKDYLDRVKGYVQPFIHYKLNVAQDDFLLILQGNLEDFVSGDITEITELQTEMIDMPQVWTYQCPFSTEKLPTHEMSDDAILTGIYQELQVLFDMSLAAGTAYIDDLTLLPIDNGYAVVLSVETQYIIFDSNSGMPFVLTSLDGTKNKAVALSTANLRDRFRADPQIGSNYAILSIWTDTSGNHFGQFLDNVTLKYKPLYLVVA